MKPEQLRPCDLCRELLQHRQLTFWRISLQHFGFVSPAKAGDDVALLLAETLDLFVCEGCATQSYPIVQLGEMARHRSVERKQQGRPDDDVRPDPN